MPRFKVGDIVTFKYNSKLHRKPIICKNGAKVIIVKVLMGPPVIPTYEHYIIRTDKGREFYIDHSFLY
jgi:hypothetical protein